MIAMCLAVALAVTPLSSEELAARHGGARRFAADIVQTKTGKYWSRPFVSQIRLTWDATRLDWETVAPVRSLVSIEGDHIRIQTASGRRDLAGIAQDARFRAVIELLQALVRADVPLVERHFKLTWRDHDLRLEPIVKSQVPFESMTFHFRDEDLEIANVEVVTAVEVTQLEFKNVERER